MKKCVDNPGWIDLSNKYFVLLGAGSAMGTFPSLDGPRRQRDCH